MFAAGIAAITFLQLIVGYDVINNKSLSLAVFLLSLRAKNPTHLGLGLGLAGLLAQQTVIAYPFVAWYRQWSFREFASFSLTGGLVVVVGYAMIGILWGREALRAGLRQSLFIAGSYTAGTASLGMQIPVWQDPGQWLILAVKAQVPLLLPGVIGVLGAVYLLRTEQLTRKRWFELAVACGFLSLLFVRPWWHYTYYPTIPLSMVGGVAVSRFIDLQR